MRDLVKFLAQSVVEHPDQVEVAELETPEGLVCEIRVSPDDMGKLIGRSGRTIQAIRLVTRAAAAKRGLRVGVEIADAERAARRDG